MSPLPSKAYQSPAPNALDGEVNVLRLALNERSPEQLAERIGASFSRIDPLHGRIQLAYFSAAISISFPDLVACGENGEPLPLPVQALLLYHLTRGDGAPLAGVWASFGELPDGRVYEQAYQGYSGDQLVKTFGVQLDSFRQACEKAGGQRISGLGDAAYRFEALPRIPLLVTYWLGEDEFPSSAKVLFDRSACHHLPIDVCAILGKMLVSRIVKAKR